MKTTISFLNKNYQDVQSEVTLEGWLRTNRFQKEFGFII